MRETITGRRLFFPVCWVVLTPEQRAAAYNGTGPGHWHPWLRYILDLIFLWAAIAVMIHDVEYTYSDSKFKADLRLLANCWLLGNSITEHAMGVLAFFGVLLFGRKAWRAGHNEISQ